MSIHLSPEFIASGGPKGGLKLRIRAPGYPQTQIKSATMAGKVMAGSTINATEETVTFAQIPTKATDLEQIVIRIV